MTILSIAQKIAQSTGFESPSFLVGNADPIAMQLLALIDDETRCLSDEFGWQALKIRTTFNFVANQQNYPVPTDFKNVVPNTMWNFTFRRPLIMPINAEEFEIQMNYLITSGIDKMVYIYQNQIWITPIPGSTDTINYEYYTLNIYQDGSGTGKPAITADTDVITIREYLVQLGTKVRFLNAKGIDNSYEMQDYERQKLKAMEIDGFNQKVINMNSGGYTYWKAAYTQDSNYPSS